MKMKASEVLALADAVGQLVGKQFKTVKASYRFSRLQEKVNAELKPINNERTKIQDEYMENRDGKKVPKEGMDEEIAAKWKELNDMETDIEFHRIDLADFEGMSMVLPGTEKEAAKKIEYVPEPWILNALEKCGCLTAAEEKAPEAK
jgi:hypothetical protein